MRERKKLEREKIKLLSSKSRVSPLQKTSSKDGYLDNFFNEDEGRCKSAIFDTESTPRRKVFTGQMSTYSCER